MPFEFLLWIYFAYSPKMTKYWLISIPGEPTKEDAFKALSVSQQHDGQVFTFSVPDLKVGTLDSLISLSDELAQSDNIAQNTVSQIFSSLCTSSEKSKEELLDRLQINQVSIHEYITNFQWDVEKYSPQMPITQIYSALMDNISRIESDVRAKEISYTSTKVSLNQLEQQDGNTLVNRQLGDLIDPQDVVNSEFLQTIAVVVPLSKAKHFLNSYETLAPMIVPRSAKHITDDKNHSLFIMTIFKKGIIGLQVAARENNFSVRDIEFDISKLENMRKEKCQLESDIQVHFASLITTLMTAFSNVVIDWIHLKGLRLIVESILRYGLPPNFQGALLLPFKRHDKKMKISLLSMYSHISELHQHKQMQPRPRRRHRFRRHSQNPETQSLVGGTEVRAPTNENKEDILMDEEDYPFVFLSLTVDF